MDEDGCEVWRVTNTSPDAAAFVQRLDRIASLRYDLEPAR